MASTYLTRTASAGNRKTWTFSAWVKRSALTSSGYQTLFSSDQAANNSVRIKFDSSPNDTKFEVYYYTGTQQLQLATNRLFRDTSAWYHIVVAVDTTQATASDRAKIYVNGVQETSFAIETYPSQNTDTSVNQSTAPHQVGNGGGNLYFEGLMSHVHLIDGTAYDATAFGEYDANGVWKIIASPSVTYGTNGFFILKNGNSVTDQSGNGNNFTVAGGTLTNTEDSPSNVFATWNPISGRSSAISFSNGNNTLANTGADAWNTKVGLSTISFESGKFYMESKITAVGNMYVGGILIDPNPETYNSSLGLNSSGNGIAYYEGGSIFSGGSEVQTSLASFSVGDILGVAADRDNGTVQFYKNGSTVGTQITGLSTTKQWVFAANWYNAGGLSTNFGNGYFGTTAVASAGTNASGIGIFEYDVPTGYTALSTKGLNL